MIFVAEIGCSECLNELGPILLTKKCFLWFWI